MKKIGVLQELAECYRGDWSDFDGRTLRGQIEEWIALEDTDEAIIKFRIENSMCLKGNGHWKEYCEDYDTPTTEKGAK